MSRHLLLSLILSLALFSIGTNAAKYYITIGGEVAYNIVPFNKHGAYNVKITDNYRDNNNINQKYDFNLNMSLASPKVSDCAGKDDIWATYNKTNEDPVKCKELFKDKPLYQFIDPSDVDKGFQIVFKKTDTSPYALTIKLICNKDMSYQDETNFVGTIDSATNEIVATASTPYSCPTFSLEMISKFVDANKIWFIIAYVVLGMFLLLFGLRLFKYAIFIISTIVITIGMCVILFMAFTPKEVKPWYYVIAGVSTVIGLIAGWLSVRYKKFGFLGLGVGLGVVIGLFAWSSVLHNIFEKQEYVFYILMVLCGAIGGFLIFYLRKNITILATAIIGAYIFARGCSIWWGGFPNEIRVATGSEEFKPLAYGYLAMMCILAAIGIFVQVKVKKRREAEEAKIAAQTGVVDPHAPPAADTPYQPAP